METSLETFRLLETLSPQFFFQCFFLLLLLSSVSSFYLVQASIYGSTQSADSLLRIPQPPKQLVLQSASLPLRTLPRQRCLLFLAAISSESHSDESSSPAARFLKILLATPAFNRVIYRPRARAANLFCCHSSTYRGRTLVCFFFFLSKFVSTSPSPPSSSSTIAFSSMKFPLRGERSASLTTPARGRQI